MTDPLPFQRPAGTGTPQPQVANGSRPATNVCGREKAARQGVLSALPAEQHPSVPPPGDGRFPVAWLHIRAPRGATPTATSTCLCGRNRSAIGRRKALALINDHEAHREHCPLRITQEGRNAA
ncbi:hypothetical protein [Streptomyces alboflavus]|uniref:hypothetical protein n=1 Tax=Streptomyces alboflavus TaxID=67267 RepID=UPI001F003985|nr:hypothetical protein [Streptomyces alboflavus]